MARLIRQGLSRHEAIHAVGAVLAEDMFALGARLLLFDFERTPNTFIDDGSWSYIANRRCCAE
ncbi:MAG: hypothetical protein R8K50_06930, partial [Mariprofundus sp.]